VNRFEEAWQQEVPPRLESFLPPPAEGESRRAALLILVPIDLEYRWRRAAVSGGSSWVLEDYVRHFSELGALDDLPPELIVEEYRVRHRWGDAPGADVFARRFPARAADLAGLLQRMDCQLAAERTRRRAYEQPGLPLPAATASAPPDAILVVPSPDGIGAVQGAVTNGERGDVPFAVRAVDFPLALAENPPAPLLGLSLSELVEALGQVGLLRPSQMEELLRDSSQRFGDVQALAHELLGRSSGCAA
jgi:hypothetical protein